VTLTPTDILKIQSAIERYEKRFPRKPSPSADDALAWHAGKRWSLPRSNARDRSALSHRGIWSWICQSLRVWRQTGVE
jgi:hypothetical protein